MENKLILHRGYKGKYPENSLIGFKNAIKEGFPTEIDIRITKDNIPVIIHDDILDRLFDSSGKISDYNLEELKRFHYKENSTQTMATLKEFCDVMEKDGNKKSIVFIHIKELKNIPTVISVLKRYNIDDRIRFFAVDELIESFKKIMRKKYSEYKIGLHLFENSSYSEKRFKLFDFIWADEINLKWIDKEKVELAHGLEMPFYAISPELIKESIFNKNIEGRWKELLDSGIDGICTDLLSEFRDFC